MATISVSAAMDLRHLLMFPRLLLRREYAFKRRPNRRRKPSLYEHRSAGSSPTPESAGETPTQTGLMGTQLPATRTATADRLARSYRKVRSW